MLNKLRFAGLKLASQDFNSFKHQANTKLHLKFNIKIENCHINVLFCAAHQGKNVKIHHTQAYLEPLYRTSPFIWEPWVKIFLSSPTSSPQSQTQSPRPRRRTGQTRDTITPDGRRESQAHSCHPALPAHATAARTTGLRASVPKSLNAPRPPPEERKKFARKKCAQFCAHWPTGYALHAGYKHTAYKHILLISIKNVGPEFAHIDFNVNFFQI